MLSGADVRQALQAGLWKALEGDSDRAAMRATCRDARDMADELHDTAVLPVGPDTWDSATAIAAYHRKLGTMQSLRVQYSCEADDARAAQFVGAYSAALGAALPVDSCTIGMTSKRQLGASFAAALLQRVVPCVERLDMALGSYDNLVQLLTLLQPCRHLRSLRLLPADDDDAREPEACVLLASWDDQARLVLEALCGLTRLHTLSGPFYMEYDALQRLSAAVPSLTTLGFGWLNLRYAPCACISRQLHTLAGWRRSAYDDARSQPPSSPWRLSDSCRSASCISGVHTLQSSLPSVQHLDSVVLDAAYEPGGDIALSAATAIAQRFAACAERWVFMVPFNRADWLVAAQGLANDSLAPIRHMVFHTVVEMADFEPNRAATFLRCLIAAAPNATMIAVRFDLHGRPPRALVHMLKPLCRAARLHTLHLHLGRLKAPTHEVEVDQPAVWLAEVVRGLVRPNADGECCRALKRVLLAGAQPDALAACRAALARDGICVSLDACEVYW